MPKEVDDLFADPLGESSDDALIAELQNRGYLAHRPEPAVKPVKVDIDRLKGDQIKIGVISDTHFGSKFQQPTYLVEHLRYMAKQKVDVIIHGGDITDGSTKMHPGFEYEIWALGADAQEMAAVEVMAPEAAKMKVPWYFIGGNHDNSHWKAAGIDMADKICGHSEWFNYLTPGRGGARNSVGSIRVDNLDIQVCHPHMGSAYALSYRPQKWIEQLSPENKPHVVLMGNFHKVLQLEYRNVFSLLLPSYQAQSAWMASKGIASYIGGAILDIGTDLRGMAPSVKVEWLLERVPIENDWPGG